MSAPAIAPVIAIDPAIAARLGAPLVLVERALGDVHATWLDALDPPTRQALESPSTPADVWLARWALVDLPVAAPPIMPLELAWLLRIGTEQVALALGRSSRQDLGPRRAAIARCKDAKLDDELSIIRVACRVLAPHIAANRLAVLQLTRAQPRPIGLVMERELLAHSEVALDQVPTWDALVAH